MSNAAVLFDSIETASGHRFGVATLNAPASLNALSQEMIDLLTPQLHTWAVDASIVGMWLQGIGDKAFCAGGDLKRLYPTLPSSSDGRNAVAERYFESEYRLDHLIHTFPKPVVAWGHGIVMGGGVGLFAGASHRVATEKTRLAMPEISVGLYPDVGGSYFLSRMPGGIGRFLALTAAPLNASDAMHCGMADHRIAHAAKDAVLSAIGKATWSGDAGVDRITLTALLNDAEQGADWAPSKLEQHAHTIEALTAGDDPSATARRLRNLVSDDRWLAQAVQTFVDGAPSTAALSFELQRRAMSMSLADVFRMEYQASLGCCAHADFAEGIRALLIDKDRNPQWSPSTLDAITPDFVADHLRPRFDGPHPLIELA